MSSKRPTNDANRLPSCVATRLVGVTAMCVFIPSLLAFSSGAALGYSPYTSLVEAQLRPDKLELTIGLDLESAWLAMGEAKTAPNVEGSLPRLKKLAPDFCRLSVAGQVLAPRETDVDFRMAEGAVVLRMLFARPAAWPLRFDVTYLKLLPDYHQVRLIMRNEAGKAVRTEMLTAAKPSIKLPMPDDALTPLPTPVAPPPSAAPAALPPQPAVSFWGFVKLGLKHVLTDYDLILFLCVLLVICRRFSSAIPIIVSFTLAHSLTLALAAFHVAVVASRVAEPLIAATIIFVGAENLVRRGEPEGRWLLTLAFGAIHGFGFADVLREAGLGAAGTSTIRSLVPFNLGVELGQLIVLAILLPALWILRKRPAFVRYGVPAISVLALLLGGYWLLDCTALV